MGSNYNNKVHFNDSTSLDVDSGGQIIVAAGGNVLVGSYGVVSMPVLGSTVNTSTDVVTGTTLFNNGIVLLTQNSATTTFRLLTVKAPVKGCYLDIIIASTANTDNQVEINLGTGVGVLPCLASTTSKQYILATSDGGTTQPRQINLVGVSTALWAIVGMFPTSTAFTLGSATS
jgi:hypothetical protein